MRFIHTGDLHIGKTVNEFDMVEDQKHILNQIYNIAVEKKVDCIILAGDIYDRSVPKTEAVTAFDDFINKTIDSGIKILAISGNHDSKERLSFGAGIMEKSGLIIRGQLEKEIKPYSMTDQYGQVDFFLLPFTKPVYVEKLYEKKNLTFHQAIKECIDHMNVDEDRRNVLVTHQFVTHNGVEPVTSDSEMDIVIGGIANVEAEIFNKFDYTGLGHIHRRSKIGENNVYYSGSPLKYSFSEVHHKKSVVYVELGKKGQEKIEYIDLKPLHDMREIKGKINDLISSKVADSEDRNDYIRAILTDKEELYEPMAKLRQVYPNTMQLVIEKSEKSIDTEYVTSDIKLKSPMELFEEFYLYVNGEQLSENKKEIMADIISKAKEV